MRASLLLALLLLPASGAEPDAAKRAVLWLERNVPKLVDPEGTPRKPFTYAVTGLVYLMEEGSRTGPDRVRPIRDYLTRWIGQLEERLEDPEALPEAHGVADSRRVCQYTWPLAASALFFGELACRMLGDEEWKRFKDIYFARIGAAQEKERVLKCVCEGKAFGVTCDSRDPFGGIAAFADQQRAYTTALHAFVLLLDRGQLKIVEGRRPGGPITPKRK